MNTRVSYSVIVWAGPSYRLPFFLVTTHPALPHPSKLPNFCISSFLGCNLSAPESLSHNPWSPQFFPRLLRAPPLHPLVGCVWAPFWVCFFWFLVFFVVLVLFWGWVFFFFFVFCFFWVFCVGFFFWGFGVVLFFFWLCGCLVWFLFC